MTGEQSLNDWLAVEVLEVTKTTLGNALFADIDSNEYLNELYENILYNYSLLLFKSEQVALKDIELLDALRFADILSKSVHNKKSDTHKIWAQEIIALLDKLYPDNQTIKYYMGSVLAHTGNYRGLELRVPDYSSASVLERFYTEYNKGQVVIPAEPNKQFFRSQKKVYDHLTDDFFSYSGPTSMGKSFIMRMFIKEQVQKGAQLNFCLLVPTKALINEVTSKIINDLKELLAEHNYRVVTSAGDLGLKEKHNFILVLTPERLLYLLLSNQAFRLEYLFVDEAHKISSKDSRSAFYYKVVDLLSKRANPPRTIFSSPNIPNPEVYLRLLADSDDFSEQKLASTFAPVSQIKYLIDIVTKKTQIYNNRTERFTDVETQAPYGTLTQMVLKIGRDAQNIVYCSSTDKAVNYALDYGQFFEEMGNKELASLSDEIRDNIHSDYYLTKLIRKGIAYHIGYLPSAIKMRIEELYKAGIIHTVFCTSTLVEGVNLPADNLFITSYKNGLPEMSAVDFKNLIGRVGRIEYGLYGNVFLVRLENNVKIEKFKDLLMQDVPEQKLSIVTSLTKPQKQRIVECLRSGSIEILKYPSNQSADSYALMRKFAIILLRDLVSDNNSVVKKEFDNYLSSEIVEEIKTKFRSSAATPDDDINVSIDQTNALTAAIARGLKYPALKDNGMADYGQLMGFLEKLCKIFKWEKYESATLGKRGKKSNKLGNLSWYAVIMSQWIAGTGLSFIIERAISYKEDNPQSGVFVDGKLIDYDSTSAQHRNKVMSDTLQVIENIVLFSISNYFLRFSQEYKRFHNVTEFDNDWYEYVEYGTTNPLTIFLQRNGFSRETATYIRTHRHEYVVQSSDGRVKIRNALLQCHSPSVRREVGEIKYNAPALFIN